MKTKKICEICKIEFAYYNYFNIERSKCKECKSLNPNKVKVRFLRKTYNIPHKIAEKSARRIFKTKQTLKKMNERDLTICPSCSEEHDFDLEVLVSYEDKNGSDYFNCRNCGADLIYTNENKVVVDNGVFDKI